MRQLSARSVDQLAQPVRDQFEQDGKSTGFFERLGIVQYLFGQSCRLTLQAEAAQGADGLRGQPEVADGRDAGIHNAPVHPDIADKAEKSLAAHFSGKRLNHFLPLPNIGGARLVEFAKDRFVVPTDFRAAPQASAEPSGHSRVASAAELQAKPIRWLWPEAFAIGKLNLLGGLPGLGKSQVTLALAAALTKGGTLPDGSTAPLGNVLILASEDDPADTINPRLQAAGADMKRVFVRDDALNLATDLDRLKEMVAAIGGVILIIFDPISRYVEGPSPSVRRALTEAIQWAAREEIALIGIQHPPKGESANVQNLFGGAAAFMQLTRAAWMILPDGDGRGFMLFAKGNIIKDRRGYSYSIGGVELPGGIETSRVVWDAERVAMTADEFLAGGTAPKPARPRCEPKAPRPRSGARSSR